MQSKTTSQPTDPEFIAHPDAQRLCEVPQNNETELALCRYDDETNKLIQCHQFVHCRDFMLDAMVGVESNRDMGIYSFKYLKTYPRPDAENISLLVRFHSDGRLKDFEKNLSILKGIEDFMNFSTSYAKLVDYPGKHKVVWILGDNRWQKNALAFSLYTYLMKCLSYKIKDPSKWMQEIKALNTVESQYMDEDYMNFLFSNMESIIKRYKNFSGFSDQKTKDVGSIHNFTGFRSMMKLLWKRPEKLDSYMESLYGTHALKEGIAT